MVGGLAFMCRKAARCGYSCTKNRPCRSQSVQSSVEAGECRGSEGTQEDGCVRTKRMDQRPATVPCGATPAGQPPSVKEWANHTVWNERRLDALHGGVRGGKWHTLMDKVDKPLNL